MNVLKISSTPTISCSTGVVLSKVETESFRMNDNDIGWSNGLTLKQGGLQKWEPASYGGQ